MNVEIGTETPIILFWEYLFRNFGILSLQCIRNCNETALCYIEQGVYAVYYMSGMSALDI
jgi:hypothetical protein